MSNNVHLSGPVANLPNSGSTVYFSEYAADAGSFKSNTKGTAAPVREMQNALSVAFWGEDNRFPQNIVNQMDYYGMGKAPWTGKQRRFMAPASCPAKSRALMRKQALLENCRVH